MAEILRFRQLMAKLDERVAKAITAQNVSVLVGYTAKYALHLHERIEMKWRGLPRARDVRLGKDGVVYTGYRMGKLPGLFWGPTGQAKFLEQPARELAGNGTLGSMIVTALSRGKTVAQALLAAGLRLQRESMKLVPVLTGNLRASAFTRLEVNQQDYTQTLLDVDAQAPEQGGEQ